MTKIPFALVPPPLLEKMYRPFLIVGHTIETVLFPNFNLKLQQARMDITARKYFSMCALNDTIAAGLIGTLFGFMLTKSKTPFMSPLLFGLLSFLFLFMFFLFQQRGAPEMYIKKRVDNLEQNVLPSLQNILIQLRSGIPLFDVLVNTASSDYGEVSREFMGVVKRINGGIPQVDALEKMALENPSPIFRSAIWQMVNGMKTGTDLSDILRDIMVALAEEQIFQVEEYGATLSPLTMFYMISAVILPAIGVNFLIVIAAFMNLDLGTTKGVFYGVYGMILMIQLMFLNIIKSKRPSLLKE